MKCFLYKQGLLHGCHLAQFKYRRKYNLVKLILIESEQNSQYFEFCVKHLKQIYSEILAVF